MKDTRMKHFLTVGMSNTGRMIVGSGETAAIANNEFQDNGGVHMRMNMEFMYDPDQRSTAQAVQLELGL